MPERTLCNCRILIVEDEFMLADEMKLELDEAGAVVLGPVGTVEDALAMARSEQRIDGAILDVNLGGEAAYPVADVLIARGVPLVFTTGYDGTSLPDRFKAVARCEKPTTIRLITQAIGRVLHE
ncbi:DNA-binding response OmpR family regulator [Sphingomonas sp. BE138]|uniref:response regulator n=1 Tax=Sphingomonas sp. BE138 TaxID=2817845 RepID=UPI0028653560|nr:response regulator [Sphingomonas sp. BE138]MDR6787139.1 DNA-binding response OmpR family regulator [Sphingomonas sp. BE138]